MESARTATYHMRAYEHLYALTQILDAYDGVVATLRDTEVEVLNLSTRRRETFTCAPRKDADGDLWIFGHDRLAVAPAGHPDTPLTVARRLEDGQ